MEHKFELKVVITNRDDSGKTSVDLQAEGGLNQVGKSILLANIFRVLRIDPESVSDLAVISVALEKCQDD